MRVAALLSGGKDSLYAMTQTAQQGHTPMCICSVTPDNPDSYMFHAPNTHLLPTIANTLNLPLLQEHTEGEKEKELEDLQHILQRAQNKYNIEGVVTGALASQYQKERIETICTELGLESLAPLWGMEEESLWEALLPDWTVMVVAVAAEGLGKEWLGRTMDRRAVEELRSLREKHGIHLGFEGGEAETLVLNAPCYEKRIHVKEGETTWNGTHGTYTITHHRLVP